VRREFLFGATAVAALLLALSGCIPFPPLGSDPDPTQDRFAKRQLDAATLTLDDLGGGWSQVPGEEGDGGLFPGSSEAGETGLDPCSWATNWLPEYDFYYMDTWGVFTTGDGVTYASDWIAAFDDPADGPALIEAYRERLASCSPVTQIHENGEEFTVTIVPDIEPRDIADASFSFRADHSTTQDGVYGAGEVHVFVCGPIWVTLAYIGFEPFVEREALIGLLEERVSALGDC
jgi:hypothetical protein